MTLDSLQKKAIFSIPQRASMGTHMAPQVNFTLARQPYMCKVKDLSLVLALTPYILIWLLRPYFVIEVTRVIRQGKSRFVMAKVLDCDFAVSLNYNRAIPFPLGLILLGKAWPSLFSGYELNSSPTVPQGYFGIE